MLCDAGVSCFSGCTPGGGSKCDAAPLLPVLYVSMNLLYNISLLNLLRSAGTPPGHNLILLKSYMGLACMVLHMQATIAARTGPDNGRGLEGFAYASCCCQQLHLVPDPACRLRWLACRCCRPVLDQLQPDPLDHHCFHFAAALLDRDISAESSAGCWQCHTCQWPCCVQLQEVASCIASQAKEGGLKMLACSHLLTN